MDRRLEFNVLDWLNFGVILPGGMQQLIKFLKETACDKLNFLNSFVFLLLGMDDGDIALSWGSLADNVDIEIIFFLDGRNLI